MIILLKSRGKVKARELAEELEVDERMIRKYRQDLEKAGVYIESISGANGGYILQGYDYLLNLNLDKDEFFAMQLANEQLNSVEFIYYKEFKSLYNKICAIQKSVNKEAKIADYMIQDIKSIDLIDEKQKCLIFNKSIIFRNKMRIVYFSLSAGEKERIIHPYAIITYKGAFYVAAYCESRNKILEFKLSRIKELEVLKDKFEKNKDFNLKEYMKNTIGLYKDETLRIKLKIEKPMSYIVSEKLLVENQRIAWKEDESIIFEAEMQGKTDIIAWILSMGSKVSVLEPASLVEEIKSEIIKMRDVYYVES